MPVIPKYKRTQAPRQLSMQARRVDIQGLDPLAPLSEVLGQTAVVADNIAEQNSDAIANAEFAKAQSEYALWTEKINQTKGQAALTDDFVQKQANELNAQLTKRKDAIKNPYARKKFEIKLQSADYSGKISFVAQQHQNAERETMRNETYKMQLGSHDSMLRKDILNGDGFGASDTLVSLVNTVVAYNLAVGQDEQMAAENARQSVSTYVEKLMTEYREKLSAEQYEQLVRSVSPFVADGTRIFLQRESEEKRGLAGAAYDASSNWSWNGGSDNTTGGTSSHTTAVPQKTSVYGFSAERTPSGNIAITGNGKSLTIGTQNRITPETLNRHITELNMTFTLHEGGKFAGVQNVALMKEHIPYILQLERETGVPAEYLIANTIAESGWNRNAYHPDSKAEGVAQFIPSSAERWKVDVKDVKSSLRGMANYLKYLHEKFGFTWEQAVGAYNTGEGNMQKILSGKRKISTQTRNHMTKIAMTVPLIQNMLGRDTQPESVAVGTGGASASVATQTISGTASTGGQTASTENQALPVTTVAPTNITPNAGTQVTAVGGQGFISSVQKQYPDPTLWTDSQFIQDAAEYYNVGDKYRHGIPHPSVPPDVQAKVKVYAETTKQFATGQTQIIEGIKQMANEATNAGRVFGVENVPPSEWNRLHPNVRPRVASMLAANIEGTAEKSIKDMFGDKPGQIGDAVCYEMYVAHDKATSAGLKSPIDDPRKLPYIEAGYLRESERRRDMDIGVLDKATNYALNQLTGLGLIQIPENGIERAQFNRALMGQLRGMRAIKAEGNISISHNDILAAAKYVLAKVPTREGEFFNNAMPRYQAMTSIIHRERDDNEMVIPYKDDYNVAYKDLVAVGIEKPTKELVHYAYTLRLLAAGAELRPETIKFLAAFEQNPEMIFGESQTMWDKDKYFKEVYKQMEKQAETKEADEFYRFKGRFGGL